jgi:hypothetical protein
MSSLRKSRSRDDIGGVIASLLNPENSWINAQRIEVSRGMFL